MNYIPKINLRVCLGIITQNTRNYAAPGGFMRKAIARKAPKKIVYEYETDAKKLVTHVCGLNILKSGEDIKLKDDSEYPDWLWKISMQKTKDMENLSPDSKAYWRLVRKENLALNLRRIKQKRIK